MTPIILMVMLYIAKLLLETYALLFVTSLIKGWTRLYTLPAPRCEREELRVHIVSALHDRITSGREEGYSPVQIALREFCSWLSGAVGDIAWSAPLVLESLPERLERGSEAVRRFKTPALLIVTLGMFLMLNFFGLFAEDRQRTDLLMMNFGVVVAAILVWKQDQRWTRIVFYSLMFAAILGLTGFFVAFVVKHQAYNDPLFAQLMLEGGIMLMPIVSAAFWMSEFCRVRILGGKRWAAVTGTLISFLVSGALLLIFAREPWMLMFVWSAYGGALLFFILVSLGFAFGAAAICSGILRTTALAMCSLAAAMRRLR